MRRERWIRAILLLVVGALATPSPADAQFGRGRVSPPGSDGLVQPAFDRGMREGRRLGAEDVRQGRDFNVEFHVIYREGTEGYQPRDGSRDAYRLAFRRGFLTGYREGYDRFRLERREERNPGRTIRGYQEPAYARGYSDGYQRGWDDGRDRDRYDAVGHRHYREADEGYDRGYGSRDAYRNNYRAGFRPGYDEGYRDGQRSRR